MAKLEGYEQWCTAFVCPSFSRVAIMFATAYTSFTRLASAFLDLLYDSACLLYFLLREREDLLRQRRQEIFNCAVP